MARGVVRRTGARGISLRASQAWALDEIYQGWLGEQKRLPMAFPVVSLILISMRLVAVVLAIMILISNA